LFGMGLRQSKEGWLVARGVGLEQYRGGGGGGGVSSVDYWQSRSADQRAAIVLSLASMLIKA